MACRNPHAGSDGRTNAKSIPLHKTLEFVHTSKVEICGKSCNIAFINMRVFRNFASLSLQIERTST